MCRAFSPENLTNCFYPALSGWAGMSTRRRRSGRNNPSLESHQMGDSITISKHNQPEYLSNIDLSYSAISPDISRRSTGRDASLTQRVLHEWIAVYKRRGPL